MEGNTELIAPTTEQLDKKWNGFSEGYSKYISPNFISLGLEMAHLVNITEAESILEVGCGDGLLSAEICLLKPEDSIFYSSDLAINMCKRTYANVSKLAELMNEPLGILNYRQKLAESKDDLDLDEIDLGEENTAEIDLFNWKVIQADNEKLTSYGDEMFDAYLACLSLHAVNNPDKMIKECLRVLKPGGKACFSVWGLKENSYFFTSAGKVMKQCGVNKVDNIRTPWHLGNREELIKRFKENGFNKVLAYYGFNAFRWFDDEFLDHFAPIFVDEFAGKLGLDEEKVNELIEALKQEFKRVQLEEEIVIGFSTLIVVVEKDNE